MQTDSELESDTSSINDGLPGGLSNLPLSKEQLDKRIASLVQENRVLKIEIDTFKMRVKALQEENKDLRKASVNIQARYLALDYNFIRVSICFIKRPEPNKKKNIFQTSCSKKFNRLKKKKKL
jgi:hypothetical protein